MGSSSIGSRKTARFDRSRLVENKYTMGFSRV